MNATKLIYKWSLQPLVILVTAMIK